MNFSMRGRRVLLVCLLLTASALVAEDLSAGSIPSTTGDFFTLTPCRVYDTRQLPAGPLHSGVDRLIPFFGICGVPATARAVAINMTVIGPSNAGDLTVYPANFPNPGVSNIYFDFRELLSNHAVLLLSTNGTGSLRVTPFIFGNGTSGFVVDIDGYFE